MNAITYFKLKSPYDGDVTKNCALTGLEVDNNFYTLEGRDIQSVELEDGKIVINLMNGEKLSTDNITEGCLKDLTIGFDEHEGVLKITKNGVTQEIGGFVTHYNQYEAIATDGSLIGKGLVNSPSGISPVYKTGQYRPVKRIIDITNDESLPKKCKVLPGDRYLTIENVNEYGYLYNYEGVKKIACKLMETHSEWRIPTKEDWDDMLNAIEPNDKFKNHNDTRSNKFLGRFAGKLLKTSKCWKEDENNDCCDCYNDEVTDQTCNCGKDIACHPNYCGEYGTCHHRHKIDNSGIDKYCFSAVPSGYANEAKDFLYFKERAYFWTATNHEYRDAYIKAFAYNKSSVLQDILAGDNYLSLRLVKDYTGDNFNERDNILGGSYSTVLMPSVKNGQAIWTSVNIGLIDCECNCHCKYVLPNDGQDMNFIKKYFTNEWNGKEWIKKELADGESVVVINELVSQQETCNDHCHCHCDDNEPVYKTNYIEYRVVNGELVDVARLIYDNVMEDIQPKLDEITANVEDLSERLESEITRSTTKDAELEAAIQMESEAREAKDAELEQAIAAEASARESVDNQLWEGLNGETARAQEVEGQLWKGINDEASARESVDNQLWEGLNGETARAQEVESQLWQGINGETARAQEVEGQLWDAINTEAAAREAKDSELEERIAAEEQTRAEKDTELEGMMLTQEGTEFDSESGILTLKSKEGTNDIQVQFYSNFGTF